MSNPKGIDISHYQPTVDFAKLKAGNIAFVYIKATDGSKFIDPCFTSHYTGATKAGLLRGAYHFARPNSSSGAAQAEFFLAHGGRWSRDGRMLPGALDVEYNPKGSANYGLTASQMVAWIKEFSDTYYAVTGVYPVIYTTTDWWKSCTGNSEAFGLTNPLWLARYSSSIGVLPAGWSQATFWQYADSGPNPGDQNKFCGTLQQLQKCVTSLSGSFKLSICSEQTIKQACFGMSESI
ncbi:glycoside hydrolase family 25 protein [Fomes fomentarius]|nr:glycoside hydrolase family 25 protein [Fomes fomentarius]